MKVLRTDLINMLVAQISMIQYVWCVYVGGFRAVEYSQPKQDVFRGSCTTIIPLTSRGEGVYHFILTAHALGRGKAANIDTDPENIRQAARIVCREGNKLGFGVRGGYRLVARTSERL